MLLLYGMRRGEVLGLRWCDVSFELGQFHIHQQLQRIGKDLVQGPVKTAAGRRLLPLIGPLHDGLLDMYARRNACTTENAAARVAGDVSLVFLSSTDTPIDPKNFVRAFHEISRKAGLPYIKLHHTRHTAATMLKNLGVPARDAQLILGHAHVTTTQQLYQHADMRASPRRSRPHRTCPGTVRASTQQNASRAPSGTSPPIPSACCWPWSSPPHRFKTPTAARVRPAAGGGHHRRIGSRHQRRQESG